MNSRSLRRLEALEAAVMRPLLEELHTAVNAFAACLIAAAPEDGGAGIDSEEPFYAVMAEFSEAQVSVLDAAFAGQYTASTPGLDAPTLRLLISAFRRYAEAHQPG